jgi:ribose transport system substrate-binding protein
VKTNHLIAIVPFLFLGAYLGGCSLEERQSGKTSSSKVGPGIGPKRGDKFVVGWVPMDTPKNEYWKAYDDGLAQAVEEAGGKVLYFSPQGNPVNQHDCVTQLIALDVDIILIYPIDSNAIGAAIQEANAAGIPVGLLWNPVPKASGASVDMTVTIDENEAARQSARALVVALEKKNGKPSGAVLEVQGRMVTEGGKRRGAGFHDVVDAFPDIKVTSKPADWDTGIATTIIQDWFTAYPNTDAIFFHSDGAYTPAAVAALSSLGRWVPNNNAKHVLCTGIDGSNIAVHAIRHGFMEYTSGAEHADMGKLLGSLAMEYLKTGKLPKPNDKIPRPDTSWKTASVVENPSYAGPLVMIPISAIRQANANNPTLFANQHQSAPNGLSECAWRIAVH